ncbi:hypothetical protein [Hufsiella ginkgonis]|uniref:Fibronectin type III domain-containing protein n=1 Tax=Hufsiella ginkgonis TaxID=2695274 RepID=A0A7K1Y280_9SPHI|nr:hypothetical protein [Hufsiella ginkgonis]MXV16786.1 hypothetical protein [Hufsiella ginkgonis]
MQSFEKADPAYAAAPFYLADDVAGGTYYWRVHAVNSKGAAEGPVRPYRIPPVFPRVW